MKVTSKKIVPKPTNRVHSVTVVLTQREAELLCLWAGNSVSDGVTMIINKDNNIAVTRQSCNRADPTEVSALVTGLYNHIAKSMDVK